MMYRLVICDTIYEDKLSDGNSSTYELLGDRASIWFLWFTLKECGKKHVEVFDLSGHKQRPEKGLNGID